ncbi:MAG: copper homeostasis protein CutC [Planctomycetota bacterium]
MKIILEACIDSVESASAAQQGGADRVELCANLMEGGTTPSAGTIRLARERIDMAMYVMIRPRGGDFHYSAVEFEIMKRDIEIAAEAGADGVVMGLLNTDGTVDEARTRKLIELARPMRITFHRAFDMTRDPFEALEALIRLGVERILTSGQERTVMEGLDLIAELNEAAKGRIIIMPGCGITERNIAKVLKATGASEVHVAAWASLESAMKFRNAHCFMGGELRPPEFSLMTTDSLRIRSFIEAMEA